MPLQGEAQHARDIGMCEAANSDGQGGKTRADCQAAEALAAELGIHSAIVAGRVRHEYESYRHLSHMVGRGKVRKLFYDLEGVQG